MFQNISPSLLLGSLFTFIQEEYQDEPKLQPLPVDRTYEGHSESWLKTYSWLIAISLSLSFVYLVTHFYFTEEKNKSELPPSPSPTPTPMSNVAIKKPKLHWAIKMKLFDDTSSLLNEGADIFEVDSEGNTPLHEAVINNNHYIVELLLNQGGVAAINQANDAGDTPLHLNLCVNSKIAELLLFNGADITRKNRNGKTALTQVDSDGNTYLHSAILNKNIKLQQFLLERHCVDIDQGNCQGNTPLHCAISSNSLDSVRLLLHHGAAINKPNNIGATPLHYAIFPKSNRVPIDTVTAWIASGVGMAEYMDPDLKPHFRSEYYYIIRNLLLWRAAPRVAINQGDNNGNTPFHWAIWKGDVDVIGYLLKMGAQINSMNHNKETPITQVNNEGNSPLHLAVVFLNVRLIEFLLKNGADPSQTNRQAQTPFDLIPEDRSDIKTLFTERFLWNTWELEENLQSRQSENESQSAANTGNSQTVYTFYHQWLPREVLGDTLELLLSKASK